MVKSVMSPMMTTSVRAWFGRDERPPTSGVSPTREPRCSGDAEESGADPQPTQPGTETANRAKTLPFEGWSRDR